MTHSRQALASVIAALETWATPEPNSGCWLWLRPVGSGGYGQIMLNGVTYRAHRLLYEIANGPIPAGLCVCHRCDVRSCVNPAHLFLGTYQDNKHDCMSKKRDFWSRDNRQASAFLSAARSRVKNYRRVQKLTEQDVIELRRLAGAMTQDALAAKFGISQSTVHNIVKGKYWSHIPRSESSRLAIVEKEG